MFSAIQELTAKADDPEAAHDKKTTTIAEVDEAASEKPTLAVADAHTQGRILVGILLGDFMHNLVDGIFIGFAFMSCGTATGWTITAATVAHEVGQEIADYLVLTNPSQGNLKPLKALALNFVSGLSVILGVIIVLAQGAEDNFSNGMLLAFGGGIYVHIGAAECMSRCAAVARTLLLRLMAIGIFIIGAIVIGVVLVSHEHCVAGGGGHDHAH